MVVSQLNSDGQRLYCLMVENTHTQTHTHTHTHTHTQTKQNKQKKKNKKKKKRAFLLFTSILSLFSALALLSGIHFKKGIHSLVISILLSIQHVCSAYSKNRYNSGIVLCNKVRILTLPGEVDILTLRDDSGIAPTHNRDKVKITIIVHVFVISFLLLTVNETFVNFLRIWKYNNFFRIWKYNKRIN